MALVEFHVNWAALPAKTVEGAEERVTVGGGGDAATVTLVVAMLDPPGPAHVSVKLVVAVSAPVKKLPLLLCAPLHPPEAVQEVALVVVQLKVAVPPTTTVDGVGERLMVGGADASTVTMVEATVEPPGPVQLSV